MKCIGELILVFCFHTLLDDLCETLSKQRRILHIIETNHCEMTLWMFRLFDQLGYAAIDDLSNSESPWVAHLFHTEGRLLSSKDRTEINIKDCIAENDENRFMPDCFEGEVDRVAETEGFCLLNVINAQRWIRP